MNETSPFGEYISRDHLVRPEDSLMPLQNQSITGEWVKKIASGSFRLCAVLVQPGKLAGRAIGGRISADNSELGGKVGAIAMGVFMAVCLGLGIGLTAVLGPAALIFAAPAVILMLTSLYYAITDRPGEGAKELYTKINNQMNSSSTAEIKLKTWSEIEIVVHSDSEIDSDLEIETEIEKSDSESNTL